MLSITAASAALNLSDIPFPDVLSGVRVAEVEGAFVCNPSFAQRETATMDLVVAGTDDIIVMIEGECREVPEEKLLDAIDFAHGWIRKLNALQRELVAQAGAKPKFPVEGGRSATPRWPRRWRSSSGADLTAAVRIAGKMERQEAVEALGDQGRRDLQGRRRRAARRGRRPSSTISRRSRCAR